MTPTSKLRFIERSRLDYPGALTGRYVQVLQQWWEDVTYFDMITGKQKGEWRDVPVEKEE